MSSWQDKFYNVTWKEFNSLTFLLAQKIEQSHSNLSLIVAIARGGLTLAQLLSDHLNLPIAAFTAQSYKDLKQQSLPRITYPLNSDMKNKQILVADDVCDTGQTFLKGLSHLQELGASQQRITTCSLFYKPHSQYRPHYFMVETKQWVIYPYEVRETIDQLVPIWNKASVSKQEMIKRFLSFEFPEKQLERYLKVKV